MILLAAVLAGVVAGALCARRGRRQLQPPNLKYVWIVPLAFLPQLMVIRLPGIRIDVPSEWASAALVSTQFALLVFVWFNRRQAGFWLLGLGLAANLLVILLNGGFMPITPEQAARLWIDAPPDFIQVGQRLGRGKDIVLPVEQTRLWLLSDIFFFGFDSPEFRAAFSIGDVLIGVGAFWFFWAMGGEPVAHAA